MTPAADFAPPEVDHPHPLPSRAGSYIYDPATDTMTQIEFGTVMPDPNAPLPSARADKMLTAAGLAAAAADDPDVQFIPTPKAARRGPDAATTTSADAPTPQAADAAPAPADPASKER